MHCEVQSPTANTLLIGQSNQKGFGENIKKYFEGKLDIN